MSRVLNEDGRYGDWMVTYTGKKFYPLDPRPDELCIEDIAHALANQCRYNGHCNYFYSVAEHSCLVAQAVKDAGGTLDEIFAALMHDANEAYYGDIIRPMKHQPEIAAVWKPIESHLQKMIYAWAGLPTAEPSIVKQMDTALLHHECAALFPRNPQKWHIPAEPIQGKSVKIQFYLPDLAEKTFLAWYRQLVFQRERERERERLAIAEVATAVLVAEQGK